MLIQILQLSATSNNDSGSTDLLSQSAGERQCEVLNIIGDDFTDGEVIWGNKDAADCLVITGSYTHNPALTNTTAGAVAAIIALLQTTDLPVLAAGFGFELLCAACGIDLEKYGQRGPGAEKIEPTNEGAKLFQGSDPLCVTAQERWLTDEFPKSLQVLARSETGVEAVRHKTKPLYGLQQRPEDFVYPSDAKMIYKNIFSLFDSLTSKRLQRLEAQE